MRVVFLCRVVMDRVPPVRATSSASNLQLRPVFGGMVTEIAFAEELPPYIFIHIA
jgi:hypothetical protein